MRKLIIVVVLVNASWLIADETVEITPISTYWTTDRVDVFPPDTDDPELIKQYDTCYHMDVDSKSHLYCHIQISESED